MKIMKSVIREQGACNYCNRGKLTALGGLAYPYEEVFVVTGKHISSNFCKDCLDDLRGFADATGQDN